MIHEEGGNLKMVYDSRELIKNINQNKNSDVLQ